MIIYNIKRRPEFNSNIHLYLTDNICYRYLSFTENYLMSSLIGTCVLKDNPALKHIICTYIRPCKNCNSIYI